MQITNLHDLPASLVRAVTYDDYDYAKAGDISVTSLILPPRIRQLMKRHAAEITEDATERIWRLIGSVGHKIVERAADPNEFTEERLSATVNGWTITGKVDILREAGGYVIEDMKFTSVWAIKDEKPDWTQQLNLYAHLAREHGFDIKALRIIAVLRDWSKPKAAREKEKDYPQVGVVVREVPLWSPKEQETFLSNRVVDHQMAEKWSDDQLPMCTPDERWRKPDVWAVKKKGNKRAIKLFETEHEAAEMVSLANSFDHGLIVEHRPGQDVRCLSYCNVRQFCQYGRSLKQGEGDESA